MIVLTFDKWCLSLDHACSI